jgi:hypothetical protein
MLRQAVLGEAWAKDAARKATTEQISFTQLFQELAAAIQQEVEEQMKIAGDSYQPPQVAALPAQINYGSRYAALPSRRSRHPLVCHNLTSPSSQVDKRKGRDMSIKCWRCGTFGHYQLQCPNKKRLSMTDAIRARVDAGGTSPASMVEALYALTTEADSIEAEEEESLAENAAAAVFHQLFFPEEAEDNDCREKDFPEEKTNGASASPLK